MSEIVLVTGGAGYVGSHACKALAASGRCPVVFDNLIHGHRKLVRWGPLEVGDLQDRARVEEVLRRYRPNAVLHFAAYAYVGESVREPGKYYRNNLSGTLNLLEAMRVCEVAHIVFSSTCATYGTPERQPITEETPQQPINPYGRGKLMVEQILEDYDLAYGLRSAKLRYFNACGADPDGEIGEIHDPETHLIPRALMASTGAIEALEIFGSDYPTPDGTCIRDYVHVCDLARAHVAALDYLLSGAASVALNLGTGRGVSVRQVVDAVGRVTGRSVPVKYSARRPGDPAILLADASRAREVLGFVPEYTDIDRICSTAWDWYTRELGGHTL